jgi:hypothetical protein
MLEELRSGEPFDVLVVGGGITGVGVALDAAARGLRTALVERDDFASGTSSKSSKMVHGGLRYLQNGDVRLVYEALRERRRLMKNAPHLVDVLPFMIPIMTKDSVVSKKIARALGSAMWMYDFTGGWRIGKFHKRVNAKQAAEHFPTTHLEKLSSGYLYYDAGADDARLVITMARTAAKRGAVLAIRCGVVDITTDAGGQTNGVVVHADGDQFPVGARVVINAAGVWADDVRALDEGANPEAKNAKGETVLSTTQAPWDVTEYIANILLIQVDREEVEEGRRRCAELLNAGKKTSPDPTARLFDAIETGNRQAVEQSLAAGANLKDRDAVRGWTPLYTGVFFGRETIVRLLLDKGAKVDTRNTDMGSPLHGAALMGRVSLIELLLEHGEEIDARDGKGSTPLHAAAFLGRVQAVECLLGQSADRALKDEAGQTALDVTRIDWGITAYVIQLLGLDLKRAEVEANRAKVAKLLQGG